VTPETLLRWHRRLVALVGVSIPPRPAQVTKLLIRHPRAGIGFIRFDARGMRPAIKAFERGDDAGALRVFLAANTSDAVVKGIPEVMFQRFVDNVGPLKAQIKAGFRPGSPLPTPGPSKCPCCWSRARSRPRTSRR
jgi:hypothetical protein